MQRERRIVDTALDGHDRSRDSRRHPPPRRDAQAAAPCGRRCRRRARVSRRALRAERLLALPRLPGSTARDGRAVPRPGLGRPRRAGRHAERRGRRARELCAPARPVLCRGGLRRRRRAPGAGGRHTPPRATGRDGRRLGDLGLCRRGHVRQRADDARLRRRRLRHLEAPRGRDDGGPPEHRPDAGVSGRGRRARPRRCRRIARAVLLASHRRRRRRLLAPRLDRRRALPEHPRLELRGDRLPGQPEGALDRRREGVPVDRRCPGRRRPCRLLRPG